MDSGARTPEELEALFEDAFVMRDRSRISALFDPAGVLASDGGPEVRGGMAIGRAAGELWAGGRTYVAGAGRVLQARDTALVVSAAGIHVARRAGDGTWRVAICFLDLPDPSHEEDPMTQSPRTLAPAVSRRGEGEARWWFAALAEITLTAEQTGGLLSIIEITEPPDASGPLHVHHREDETFWILDGDASFEVGGDTIHASAGDVVFGPRGVPHRYSVGGAGCRMLFVMTPGGFEGLVRDMSVPATSRTLPPPSDREPDWDHVAAVATAYGCELLG